MNSNEITITCYGCGSEFKQPAKDSSLQGEFDFKEFIDVRSLKSLERGFLVTGYAICENCGQTLEVIHNQVPLEFKDIKCPKCENEEFRVIPGTVERVRGQYKFSVTLQCKNKICGLKKEVKGGFKGLLNAIKKIDISIFKIGIKS